MYYIIWLSSKGGKEIYTITDSFEKAKFLKDYMNKYYKEENRKARAYITSCEDTRPYYHKEIK